MRIKTKTKDAVEDRDKQWAQRYILDPLTAPEPSQETGPGTSHVNQYRASFFSAARDLKQLSLDDDGDSFSSSTRARAKAPRAPSADDDHSSGYPTPPSSDTASPTRGGGGARGSAGSGSGSGSGSAALHPSNPFSRAASATSYARLDTHSPGHGSISPPLSSPPPPQQHQHSRSNSKHSSASHRSSHSGTYKPTSHRRHPSAPTPVRPYFDEQYSSSPPHPGYLHYYHDHRSQSGVPGFNTTTTSLQRHRSLHQRFPGDMSHRPLDMLRADARAADRGPHKRHRKRVSETDTIDALDTIGGAYHHGGPYDATLTSRNLNQKYSPVAAVQASNEAALRATPRENIQDSLERHVPLQGTATIPAGARDLSGRVMDYEEGADLMREPDADGGAYKRWPGVQYHPEDYKGKGEPSFTIERDLKARKHGKHLSEADAFEMHPGANRGRVRSVSNTDREGAAATGSDDLRRSNTTGKKFSEGIKRRFGSLRHRKSAEAQ